MSKETPDTTEPVGPSHDPWNDIADGWHQWIPRMREWYEPATSLMLDLARIGPGSRVLDVAAGDGDQSLSAAERVGADGYVLATDPAADLLAYAQRSAERAGLANLKTRVMDGESLDLKDGYFDAVICRFGLMFLSDPIRGLVEMNRVLRRRGRVSIVVYGEKGSPEFSLALSLIRRRLGTGDSTPTKTTSLGDPGKLERMLGTAGLEEIEVRDLALDIRFESASECVSYLRAASPGLQHAISPASTRQARQIWSEVESELSRFAVRGGLEVEHQVLVAAATAV